MKEHIQILSEVTGYSIDELKTMTCIIPPDALEAMRIAVEEANENLLKELLEQFRFKLNNCNNSREGRARRGAYTDCIVMLKETMKKPTPPIK